MQNVHAGSTRAFKIENDELEGKLQLPFVLKNNNENQSNSEKISSRVTCRPKKSIFFSRKLCMKRV